MGVGFILFSASGTQNIGCVAGFKRGEFIPDRIYIYILNIFICIYIYIYI